MIEWLINWYHRYFTNPQVVILALVLVTLFGLVIFFNEMLAPLLIAVVIAYLLEVVVLRMQRLGVKRQPAAISVFVVFMGGMVLSLAVLTPLLYEQITRFFIEMPWMVKHIQQILMTLPEKYPSLISAEQVEQMMLSINSQAGSLGQRMWAASLASIQGIITWMVYSILIVLLVFFFLKDKEKILGWAGQYMPKDHALVSQIWAEMDQQIGNYIRGKIVEIVIVGAVSWLVFALMGLNYAALLGWLVGISVVVPFVGATLVTIPVALVAFFQWGWTTEFFYLMAAYGLIQALDGNVLVPLLFSEAVKLHPVAIVLAIIVFGGIWGVWGVFFAIPLATLVKAVLNAWPQPPEGPLPPPA
ncbi:MAG: AI-2E family transporter [Gammaproteobacteria bacterium]|nr:AI-2E family transporter [Gammaproteobacteria bacterium]